MSFCPIDQELLLTVGFSDGSLCLYDQELKRTFATDAHDEGINCLSWENKIANNSKN